MTTSSAGVAPLAPFSIQTIANTIVLVSVADMSDIASFWALFQQTYLQVYRYTPRFVLMFDLSNIETLPGFEVIDRMKALLMYLKPRTCLQVIGVVVVTRYETIAQMVTMLVMAAGQSAPFYAYTDRVVAAGTAVRMACVIKGVRVPPQAVIPQPPTRRTWAQVPPAVTIALLAVQLIRCTRHLLRRCE